MGSRGAGNANGFYVMVELTIFKNLYDNTTDKGLSFDDFDKFEAFLYEIQELPYKQKKDATLMTPATFIKGTTRANKNVIEWAGWAAVDCDDHISDGNLQEELAQLYGRYRYICYSTASSTELKPKFRLIFPLQYHVPQEKIKHFWYALNQELGDIGDAQTKDLSRMYYVPGTYTGSESFIFSNFGEIMDPQLIMSQHKYVVNTGNTFLDNLPEHMREQVIKHRKEQMTNTNVHWTGYLDCPFINKQLIAEYATISETGWYAKMYAIMVSTAVRALRQKYPITGAEIAELCRQIDMANGNWYNNRPLEREAAGAIQFAYEQVDI